MAAVARLPPQRPEFILLGGGMDQVTPTLHLPSGVVRRGANFECSINNGYSRIAGYEVFDGHDDPSSGTYTYLTVALTASVAVGVTVAGVTSSATGKVLAVGDTYLVLGRTTGEFTYNGENLTVGASPVGASSAAVTMVADAQTHAEYLALAAADLATDIDPVPGSGAIRGIARLDGVVYAWRDNVGGTAMAIYKSTAAGWVLVPLGWSLAFAASGTTPITEGQTVTGATSAATGVVARVVLESGTWAGGTAAGRLILSAKTGTFGTENLTVAAVVRATTAGGAAAITLAPGGRVSTVTANFGADLVCLYGADRVNPGFEFDGTVYVPIDTGMVDDTPDLVAVMKDHLFFAFDNSLQFSVVGLPYQWSVTIGAGEISMVAPITELRVLPGDQTNGAMAVYTDADTNVLYGYSEATFVLSNFEQSGGALRYSGAELDQPYVFSDYGVTRLRAAQEFGNFQTSSLTMKLRPFTKVRRSLVTAAISNREKGQYRIFFSDGYGLYITIINGKMVGAIPVQYDHAVSCICSGGFASGGEEVSYFGSTDGYVYREGVSTSFAGNKIPASLYLVFNSSKSPRILKEYMRAVVELTGEGFADFSFGYSLGYGTDAQEQPNDLSATADLRSSFWDEFIWDDFLFDGQGVQPASFRLEGSAENIALAFTSYSDICKPFTLNTVILNSKIRRQLYA